MLSEPEVSVEGTALKGVDFEKVKIKTECQLECMSLNKSGPD